MQAYIVSYQSGILSTVIVNNGELIRKSKAIRYIDQGLLPFLESLQRAHGAMGGIGVVTSNLGGFASSRLIIVTLNAYAWAKNIPIVRVPDRGSLEQAIDRTAKKMKSRKGFTRQVLTEYARPADITMSKSRPKFTVA